MIIPHCIVHTIVEYIDIKYQTIYTDKIFCRCLQYGTVCQKIINSLRALNNFLPPKTKVILVQILIFPINDYGDFQLNADLLNKLNHFINNCIRFIFNLYKYDHVSLSLSIEVACNSPTQRDTSINYLIYLIYFISFFYLPSSPSHFTSQF